MKIGKYIALGVLGLGSLVGNVEGSSVSDGISIYDSEPIEYYGDFEPYVFTCDRPKERLSDYVDSSLLAKKESLQEKLNNYTFEGEQVPFKMLVLEDLDGPLVKRDITTQTWQGYFSGSFEDGLIEHTSVERSSSGQGILSQMYNSDFVRVGAKGLGVLLGVITLGELRRKRLIRQDRYFLKGD